MISNSKKQASNQSEAAIMELEMITREVENIGADELGVATFLIEAVSTQVKENRNVRISFF